MARASEIACRPAEGSRPVRVEASIRHGDLAKPRRQPITQLDPRSNCPGELRNARCHVHWPAGGGHCRGFPLVAEYVRVNDVDLNGGEPPGLRPLRRIEQRVLNEVVLQVGWRSRRRSRLEQRTRLVRRTRQCTQELGLPPRLRSQHLSAGQRSWQVADKLGNIGLSCRGWRLGCGPRRRGLGMGHRQRQDPLPGTPPSARVEPYGP